MTPKVSIIVPAYNATRELRILFEALERQTAPRSAYEVIVVDDGSTDGTPDLVRASTLARVVAAPGRGGSYAARNVGIQEAAADLFAFTDADCVPDEHWVERGLAAFATDPGLDVLAGAVEMMLGHRPTAAALADAARCLDQERYATRENFGATANLWVRRTVFTAIGPFNGSLISGGDTEFGHRATGAGMRLEYGADVRVEHPARERAREIARKSWRLGYGAAQHRRHASGPLRDRPLYCIHPGSYLPDNATRGAHRIEHARGEPLSRWERFRLGAAYYLFMRLPSNFGNLYGAVRERRAEQRV